MKIRNLAIPMIIVTLAFSCNDEESTDIDLTNEESAELVANALSSDVVSYSTNLGELSYSTLSLSSARTEESRIQCGETLEENLSREYTGNRFSYSFGASYSSELTCFRSVPVLLETELSSSTTAESDRISTMTSTEGSSSITIDVDNPGNFLLNSTIESTGDLMQKNNNKTLMSKYTLELTDLSINTAYLSSLLQKETPSVNLITSGTGSFSGQISNSDGNQKSIIASIVFMDGTAEITINGQTYSVDLNTGELN